MAGFFAIYFLLLRFPIFEPKAMPETPIDRWIGFQPSALWLYVSLWCYVQLAPAFLKDRSQVLLYGKAVGLLSLAGFVVFLLWPTRLDYGSFDLAHHAAFRGLKKIDASGNACPSLHVAFAIFSAASIKQSLNEVRAPKAVGWLNVIWCFGIAYSTMATRQHVFLDCVGGAALAMAGILVYRAAQRRHATSSLPPKSMKAASKGGLHD